MNNHSLLSRQTQYDFLIPKTNGLDQMPLTDMFHILAQPLNSDLHKYPTIFVF